VFVLLGTLVSASAHARSSRYSGMRRRTAHPPDIDVVQPDRGFIDLPRLLVAELVNATGDTVRLVHAGDGSAVGWRTPLLRWHVTAGHVTAHALAVPVEELAEDWTSIHRHEHPSPVECASRRVEVHRTSALLDTENPQPAPGGRFTAAAVLWAADL
jgi:hypothetical protein